jgi:transcriptional regulator with XRE-family HTH domain
MLSFGETLKKYRIAKKYTLREVGQYIGKSIGYISDIEHNRKRPPDLDTVSKIEDFLGIEDGYLINLARKIRKNIQPSLSQRLKKNPKLSTVLLRADRLPDEKLDKLLRTLEQMEEEG